MRFAVTATPGDLLDLTVTQAGVDVTVKLLTPTRSRVPLRPSVGGVEGAERVLHVAQEIGQYTVVVTREDALPKPGRIDLLLQTVSPTDSAIPEHVRRYALMAEGNALRKRGDGPSLRAAEVRWRAALTSARKSGDRYDEALALDKVGQLIKDQGNRVAAIGPRAEALAIRREIGDRFGMAVSQLGLGNLQNYLGHLDQARDDFKAALATFRSIQDGPGEGLALTNLGLVEGDRGRTAEALAHLEAAKHVFSRVDDPVALAFTHMGLANVYRGVGDADQALHHLRAAYDIRQTRGETRHAAGTLSEIGLIELELLGRPRAAIVTLEAAEKQRTSLGYASDRAGYGAVSIARAYLELGEPEAARRRLLGALESFRAHKTDSGVAVALVALGQTELVLGRSTEALAAFEDAKRLSLTMKTPPVTASALAGAAQAEALAGHWPAAIAHSQEAIVAAETMRRAIDRQALRTLHLGRVRNVYDAGVAVLMGAAQAAEPAARPALWRRALTVHEQGRARGLRDLLLQGEVVSPTTHVLDLDELQQRLTSDEVVVDFAMGSVQSWVWLLTRDRLEVRALPGRAAIERAARSVHAALVGRDAASLSAATRRLGKLVITPMGKLAAKRLRILADGALQYVPFSLLLPDVEVTMLPGLGLPGQDKAEGPALGRVLVFADPVFSTLDPRLAATARRPDSTAPLPRLRFTRDEAVAVTEAAGDDVVSRMGFAASRGGVLAQDLSEVDVLHFAVHGTVDTRDPARSALVLSNVAEDGSALDGRLRLSDIHSLRLNARLVVLSACETALGREVRGEGLVGLTRGFLAAGADQVLASLWRVDDRAAATLMGHFYRALYGAQQSPSAALRSAQAAMRADPRWSAPHHWAAFVLYGLQ
ncbi:MAG: CHAT domain-containing protein/tetratricopeptide (TPR) repeat protein [Myxococcota bacterium]|jgi:CHAT domain-containing protein/tetratricopeptide (TPR) repeat protein